MTILIVIGALVGAVVFLFIGFWMGRHTLEKQVFEPSKTGGQPLFEADPYADALRDERNEGTL